MTKAQELAKHYKIFPCQPTGVISVSESGKKPEPKAPLTLHGYQDATQDPQKIAAWFKRYPSALIGIPARDNGFFVIDVDPAGLETWKGWIKEHGETGAGLVQKTPRGGLHVCFKHPDFDISNNAGVIAPGIDTRSRGYICTGAGYEWLPGHGPGTPLTDAPGWLLDLVRPKTPEKMNTRIITGKAKPAENAADAGRYWLEKALATAAPGNRNDTGFKLALQLRDSGLNVGSARVIMQEYAAGVPGNDYNVGEALASLSEAYQLPPREPATLPVPRAVTVYAENLVLEEQKEISALDVKNPPPETIKFISGYDCTDTGNAQRFVNLHGPDLRFVDAAGKWFVWNGKRWERDDTGEAERRAKDTARSILQEAYQETDRERAKVLTRWAFKSQSRAQINNMLELAKSEKGITIPIDQFDQDQYLLNFNNGTLDLSTGALRPHDPADFITKFIDWDYNEAAKCPRWLQFLEEVMGGNTEVIDFLQRVIGYSLTGLTSEQIFLILYGLGANGKSVFCETILNMLGTDYAMNTQPNTILVKDRSGDPRNDLARLRGIRFVTVNEIPGAGRGRLDESKVKELTGGDTITARFLFRESFQFRPTFKIWIRTNHKPIISETVQGIWRRVCMVPFTISIPPEHQDAKLQDKLRDEWPGIMAWAVLGCQIWIQEGLNIPDEVRAATAEYRAESDTFQPFMDECLIIDQNGTATAADLYAKYKDWATTNNERAMTKHLFGRELGERGFTKERPTLSTGGAGPTTYSGLKIRGAA